MSHRDNRPAHRNVRQQRSDSDEEDGNPLSRPKRQKRDPLASLAENTYTNPSTSRINQKPRNRIQLHRGRNPSRGPQQTVRASGPEQQLVTFTYSGTELSFSGDEDPTDAESASQSPMSGVENTSATSAFFRFSNEVDLVCGVGWSEYAPEVFQNLRHNEAAYHQSRDPSRVELQTEITPAMRAILVDWLVEVAEEYKLTQQTLFLAVNYVDRVLAKLVVLRHHLQLIGIACLLIASKYEEIFPPTVDDFVYIADYTYSRRQLLDMEKLVLNSLKFQLSAATCVDFTSRFLFCAGINNQDTPAFMLANYFNELSLCDFSFSKYLPSQITAASVCLAVYSLYGHFPHKAQFEHHTEYSVQDLRPCIQELHALHVKNYPPVSAPGQQCLAAVYNKYNKPERMHVSASSSLRPVLPADL